MTLLGVKILKMRKRTRVMLRNTMIRVEAPLAMPPVTAFTSAAMVGTGLGVGVVGGGTGILVHQKKGRGYSLPKNKDKSVRIGQS